nr:sigma 54-interacting transcriptional regulator [Flavobacterium sp. SaA2.13]
MINKAIDKRRLTKRIIDLESRVETKYSFEGIIGESKKLAEAIELAKKVAPIDTTVLLTGETGTGKEVFANAIHQSGKRKDNSFIAINCSAFSHDLLESEMFGHKAGAFTGAIKAIFFEFEIATDLPQKLCGFLKILIGAGVK